MTSKNSIFLNVFMGVFLSVFLGSLLLAGRAYTKNQVSSSTKTYWGLHTTTFNTSKGNIKVNLPDDIMAGDTISGTVIAEPAGKTLEEYKSNSDELSGYVVEVETEEKSLKKSTVSTIDLPKITIPTAFVNELTIKLKNPEDIIISEINVPLDQPTTMIQPKEFNIPSIGQAGRPIEIPGPFDGISDNSSVKIADKQSKVLAESPRKIVAQTPKDSVGPVEIEINEDGHITKGKFNNLKIKLSAPKTTLLKGEHTTINVRIEGFKELPKDEYPVPFELTNVSPQVIRFTDRPGTMFSKGIESSEIVEGTWTEQIQVVGITPGSFSILARVFYVTVHDAKKDLNLKDFMSWVDALKTKWQNDINKIDKMEKDAKNKGKKWPDTAKARGKQMRRGVLKAKVSQLNLAKDTASADLRIAKQIADKALADVNFIEIGAELTAFAFELLGYTDLPLPKLTTVLKGLKAVYKGKKVLKAIEAAEAAAKVYEGAKKAKDKAEKLKELKEKVQKVKEEVDKAKYK